MEETHQSILKKKGAPKTKKERYNEKMHVSMEKIEHSLSREMSREKPSIAKKLL